MLSALHERELVILLIDLVTVAFLLWQRRMLVRIPHYKTLVAAFAALLVTRISTNLEEVFEVVDPANALLLNSMNLLEHGTMALFSVLLLCWCWQTYASPRGAQT